MKPAPLDSRDCLLGLADFQSDWTTAATTKSSCFFVSRYSGSFAALTFGSDSTQPYVWTCWTFEKCLSKTIPQGNLPQTCLASLLSLQGQRCLPATTTRIRPRRERKRRDSRFWRSLPVPRKDVNIHPSLLVYLSLPHPSAPWSGTTDLWGKHPLLVSVTTE